MAEKEETPEPAQKPKSETPAGKNVGTEKPAAAQESPSSREINKDACMWAMFCHLAGLAGLLPVLPVVGSIVAPLIVWQVKKDEFPFVDEQGKEAVNFQISMLLYLLIGGVACAITCIGIPLIPVVVGVIGIVDVVFLVIASIKANDGEHYRYPLAVRFIK
jgi:uncharacterized Tic20 family protein